MRDKSGKSHSPEIISHDNKAAAEFDPELLYVECGRCGAPVVWEPGRATSLLKEAGIDPTELDSSCILITEACPACGAGPECAARIFRISDRPDDGFPPIHGNA